MTIKKPDGTTVDVADDYVLQEGETVVDDTEKGLDIEAVKTLVNTTVQETIAKRVDEMATQIVAKFSEGVAAQRKKILGGEKVEKDEKADDKTRKFMKALLSDDKMVLKAMSDSTSGSSPDDAAAGLTIPPELLAEVLRIKLVFGIARANMRYLPFSGPGNSRTIPALGTSVSTYWTEEGAKKTGTQPKFSLVTQTLKKLAAIVPMTEEILEDSAINLTELLGQLFAEAVAKEEDIQFFTGTGSPWTGILNNGNVNIINQASGDIDNLTADDFLDMVDAVPTGALNGSKFYMSRSVLSRVRKLKNTQGTYIYQNPGGGLPATLWDFPVQLSDAFPAAGDVSENDTYVLFGNLQLAAIFGDKQQIRVKLLDQATVTDTDGSTVLNLAEQDMVALRIVERVGYVLALPKAVSVLKASAHQS